MARERRVASRRSRTAREESVHAESDIDDIDEIEELDDEDYEDYESDVAVSPRKESRSASGTRRGTRGSRVGAGQSSRASSRKSVRQNVALTAEELEARRRGRKAMVNMFIMLLLLVGAAVGAYFLMQENPLVKKADLALHSAKSEYLKLENALRDAKPEIAQGAYDSGREMLIIPLLGDAEEKVADMEDPRLASVNHAWKAYQQLEKFEAKLPRIQEIRNQVKVEANLNRIRGLFIKITDLSDEEVDDLESLLEGFRLNPLDPEGEEDQIAVSKYSNHVASLGGREQDIAHERDYRKKINTTYVQEEVNKHANKLIRESHFQEALDMIDEKAKKFPEAMLAEERDRVVQSANEKWSMTKKNGDELYKDGVSAANDPDVRKESLKKAIKSMKNVIKKFGVEDIVSEAQDLKKKYESALSNLN